MKKLTKTKMEENEVLINEELLFNDLDNIIPDIEEEDVYSDKHELKKYNYRKCRYYWYFY